MFTILVKLTIFGLLFAILKSNMIYYDKTNMYHYLLLLISILIIILEFHTKNRIIGSKIAKTKKSNDIRKNLHIIQKIGLGIIFIISAYLLSKSDISKKKTDNLLNIFLLNENDI
jgi:hypothetical protein